MAIFEYLNLGDNCEDIRPDAVSIVWLMSTVNQIIVPLINYTYIKFGQICIWSSKGVVQAIMPADFKQKFLATRVIIDCTEVCSEMPSSLLLNSELFSSHKNYVTLKGLVGIAPKGAITFIT